MPPKDLRHEPPRAKAMQKRIDRVAPDPAVLGGPGYPAQLPCHPGPVQKEVGCLGLRPAKPCVQSRGENGLGDSREMPPYVRVPDAGLVELLGRGWRPP